MMRKIGFIIVGFAFVTFLYGMIGATLDCVRAETVEAEKIFGFQDAVWMFQGTYCSKCNYLYNYKEYPKVCEKCGEQTKNHYYLVLNKERK